MEKKEKKINIIRTLIILIISNTILTGCEKNDFQWNLKKAPEIGYLSVESNDAYYFKLSSEFISNGYDKNFEIGFCWSTHPNPTINDSVVKLEQNETGKFNLSMPWSNISTYHFRSFVKNDLATIYSQDCIIEWPGSNIVPQVQTVFVDLISYFTFMVNCNVISTNGQPILNKGIELFDTPNIQNSTPILTIISTSTTNSYNTTCSNLIDGEIYYVRGFVSTLAGTGYGNIISVQLPKKYSIGETGPAGGIVIYENPNNFESWHYIETAPVDISGVFNWAPNSNITFINSTEFGQGLPNTESIFNLYGSSSNYAAKMAINWNYNSYTDWVLPSLNELKKIKEIMFNQNIGNLSHETIYWSSSEDINYPINAWTVKMSMTNQNIYTTNLKSQNFKIRAIRRF